MSAGGKGSVEHRLVDCVDLQRRPLWHHVLVCPAATHLLDPSSHRLYPKVDVPTPSAAHFGETGIILPFLSGAALSGNVLPACHADVLPSNANVDVSIL